jgi:hypothetical protein
MNQQIKLGHYLDLWPKCDIGVDFLTRQPAAFAGWLADRTDAACVRLYCRGEQPITRLKAVLKALSDS